MNYVQFHLGDWLAGTALLSPTERGVYMDLLVRYYKEERPIKQEECKRIARAYAPNEQEAMQYVLQTFFTLDDEGYHHSRCDEEIEKAREISEKRKKAANGRWSKKGAGFSSENTEQKHSGCNAKEMQVHSTCNANGMLTINQEPLTINHKEIKEAIPKPDGVSLEIWNEWQKFRKKKRCSISQRILDKLTREAEKAGVTLEKAMIIQMENDWQGFEAEWLNKQSMSYQPKFVQREKPQSERVYGL